MASNPIQDRRSGLHAALSRRQGRALLEEVESARNLMRDAIRAVRGMRYLRIDGDAVFTLGSIGVEKTMKVILGCKAVDDTGAWPTQSELKYWGHDIEKLNVRLLAAIDDGVRGTTAPGYSLKLAQHVEQSTVIPLIFATFARYGRSGRFHHLDILATDQPGELDQAAEYWEKVERHVEETWAQFRQVPYNENPALDDCNRELRGFVADELDAWWFCIHRLGVQGCFGELGKKIGWEIWEPGRPAPSAVNA